MLEFIAYEGEKYTIEWYFDENGNSQALDYFKSIEKQAQIKLFHLFARMGDFGIISDKTKFRNEGDAIYAFKPKPQRFLSFFQQGRKIIITNGFHKKQDKLPKEEKQRSLRMKQSYLERVKKGDYYGEG